MLIYFADLVSECGADIDGPLKDKCLLLPNHQTGIDFLFLIRALATSSRQGCQHVLWVVNKLFMYTPMGLLALTRKYFFVSKQNKVSR